MYDLAASIDVVINKTNQKQIFHLGHSLGAAQFYILISKKPEYNKKIKININYAALIIMKDLDHPLMQAISFFSPAIKVLIFDYFALNDWKIVRTFTVDWGCTKLLFHQ